MVLEAGHEVTYGQLAVTSGARDAPSITSPLIDAVRHLIGQVFYDNIHTHPPTHLHLQQSEERKYFYLYGNWNG